MDKENRKQRYSDEVQEILRKIPNSLLVYANSVVFFIFILLLALAAFVKYPQFIEGKGVLTTFESSQIEYAKKTGRIEKLYIEDGDTVYKGQILALLESDADFNDVNYVKRNSKKIMNSINNKEEITFNKLPNQLRLGSITNDFYEFSKDLTLYNFILTKDPSAIKESKRLREISNLSKRKKILKEEIGLAKRELDIANRNFKRHEELFVKGVISKVELEEFENKYLNAKMKLNSVQTSIVNLNQSLIEKENNIDFSLVDDLNNFELVKTNLVRSFKRFKYAISQWERKNTLSSEIDGVVSFGPIWNENQNIMEGQEVFFISPLNKQKYIVNGKVGGNKLGMVKNYSIARLELENFPVGEFGYLTGEIERISKFPDSEGNYPIFITTQDSLKTNQGKKIDFNQVMKTKIKILIDQKSLLSSLFFKFKETSYN